MDSKQQSLIRRSAVSYNATPQVQAVQPQHAVSARTTPKSIKDSTSLFSPVALGDSPSKEGHDGTVAAAPAAPPQPSHSRHWSVFYPDGIEVLPPISIHYLHLGCWCTVAGGWDYFSHRHAKKGEVMGHRVEWLHTALPRDRFVFLVDPVEAKQEKSLWGMFWGAIYGVPPAFAIARGKLLWRIQEGSAAEEWKTKRNKTKDSAAKTSSTLSSAPALGVEAVEVLHSDITAMDYAPGITSSRLALETKVASAHWFRSVDDAYAFYGCSDKLCSNAAHSGGIHSTAESASLQHTTALPSTHSDLAAKMTSAKLSRPEPFVWNSSGLSESAAAHHGCMDGGEAMNSSQSSQPPRQMSSLLGQPLLSTYSDQPRSPNPSPVQLDGGPDILVLPPSTARCTPSLEPQSPKAHETYRVNSNTRQYLEANALSTMDTPTGSPDFGPMQAPVARSPETLVAEHAAAELLHATGGDGSLGIKPHHTLCLTNTMVTVYTQDPHFNAALREVLMPEEGTFPFTASLQEQKRLLSLYETGMPSWTIFVTRYGLPYRRWFRLVAVMLVNLWPLVALCVGLYDLYKHMPYLKEFLADTLTPFTSWMDHHFTLRISMLVTYLITVSYTVLFAMHSFVKSSIALINFVFAPLIPLFQLFTLLRYPLLLVWKLFAFALGPLFTLLWGAFVAIRLIIAGPFKVVFYSFHALGMMLAPSAPAATAAVQNASYFMLWWRSWLDFWDKVARPIKNVAKATYDGIVHVGVSLARREASIRRWYVKKLGAISVLINVWWDCVTMNWALFAALPTWKPSAVGILIIVAALLPALCSVLMFSGYMM